MALARQTANTTDLDLSPLLTEHLFVVAGQRNKFSGKKRLCLGDLFEAPWILSYAEIASGGPIFGAFTAARLAIPKCVVVSDSLNLRHGLLKTGRYITMIPGSALHFGPSSVSLQGSRPVALP